MSPSVDFKRFYDVFRDISTVVHSSTSVEEVLDLVVWKCTDVLVAKGTVLRILNLKTQNLELGGAYGLKEEFLSKDPIPSSKVISDLCKRNKVVIIDDVLNDPRVIHPRESWEEGVRMILDIPLILRNDIVGIMRVFFVEERSFSREELDFLVAVAEQCACAIDKARMIEEQKSQYQNLALQTEKLAALGRLAAGVAHEINNPLAGILLYSTNMLKKIPDGDPSKRILEVIVQETVRCRSIIQELLEFSREKQPEKTTANINNIVEKAVSILDNELRLRHIEVTKNLSGEIPDTLLDPNQMEQVFINILVNAIEAIQNRGKITIESDISSDRTSSIVTITDTGGGVPSEKLDQIFEPFFSTKADGTGLGLAVSYRIVENHQGEIRVSTNPGKGASFHVEIPLNQ